MQDTQTQDREARLYRVVEVTEPGTLPKGRYAAVRQGRIILEVQLEEATRPRDLIPVVKSMRGEDA